MRTKTFLEDLYTRGIRTVKMTWSCGGDDGSIQEVEFLPADRNPSKLDKENLRNLAWSVYEDLHDGATGGEFRNEGGVVVAILPEGKYKARSYNTYSEDEWNEETEESIDTNIDETTVENLKLRPQIESLY